MPTFWSVLAQVMVGLHFAFLAYLLVGGYLAWRWRRTIVVHLAAAVWGVLIIVTKVPCPLTALQNNFRERAGQRPLAGGFIANDVTGHLYPTGWDTAAQAVVAVVVLVSWVGWVRLGRRRPVDGDAGSAARERVTH